LHPQKHSISYGYNDHFNFQSSSALRWGSMVLCLFETPAPCSIYTKELVPTNHPTIRNTVIGRRENQLLGRNADNLTFSPLRERSNVI